MTHIVHICEAFFNLVVIYHALMAHIVIVMFYDLSSYYLSGVML